MIRSSVSIAILAAILCVLTGSHSTAAIRDYAVEVSATCNADPPQIDFTWPMDAGATQYWVFRKAPGDNSFGEPYAILQSTATEFSDTNVAVGQAYEYSFRKTLGYWADHFQFTPGLSVTFTIYDSWGDGMCCHRGFGHYEVSGDGAVYASGGEFGSSESTPFITGTTGEMTVSGIADCFPPETTWELTEDSSGSVLARGGPYDSPEFGHVLAGIRIPPMEDRGRVLLLVAEEALVQIEPAVDQLELDMIADGFRVRREIVLPGMDVPDIKAMIVNACLENSDIDTLMILGNVPVPYSGDVRAAHENHWGAWPADLFYAELDGEWTDETVNNTSAAWPENHNVPGDGKYDQTFLPSDVDLQIGRVDLSEMPAFDLNEFALLQRYLDRNHAFRRAEFRAEPRGLVDDNVGEAYGLAFAAFGWRHFTALCGQGTVSELDYFTTMEQDSYLLSYGCGGGSNSSCAGVGTTFDFAARSLKTVFTSLYGSYFGDWDKPNNLLRAPLASGGWPLVCFYSGRPTWHIHHMGLGHTIGFSTRLSQNADHEYTVGDSQRQIHTALMGDPTLRLHPVSPAANLALTYQGTGVQLDWDPSPEADEGYYIYRATGMYDRFERIHTEPLTEPAFFDPSPHTGTNVYMVRAITLQVSGSGSYFNLSAGITATADFPPVPTPTPTPVCWETGVVLTMPSHRFTSGSACYLDAYICNMNPETAETIPFFCLLEAGGSYWFYPGWSEDPEWIVLDEIAPGETVIHVIEPFVWPEDAGEGGGLTFLSVITDPAFSEVTGVVGHWEFSYGE
ncbi:hypothetical protein JW823_05990 [bacterium]|nr:hypothetical protein [candidate division CSSED10-310 bacterium]